MIDGSEALELALEDFGETVTVGNTARTALWQAPFEAVSPFTGGVESSGPSVVLRASEAGSVTHGTVVLRGSARYAVTGIEPDGLGGTVLRLCAAAVVTP